jgi:hypothetical protein
VVVVRGAAVVVDGGGAVTRGAARVDGGVLVVGAVVPGAEVVEVEAVAVGPGVTASSTKGVGVGVVAGGVGVGVATVVDGRAAVDPGASAAGVVIGGPTTSVTISVLPLVAEVERFAG